MCEWNDTVDLWVYINAFDSHTGKARWDFKPVDRCISDLVHALNQSGTTLTRGSCCGHGKEDGKIILQDGRELIIKKPTKETILNHVREVIKEDTQWFITDTQEFKNRSWPEDFKLENGNYNNICSECKEEFRGSKRRLLCKQCHRKLKYR